MNAIRGRLGTKKETKSVKNEALTLLSADYSLPTVELLRKLKLTKILATQRKACVK